MNEYSKNEVTESDIDLHRRGLVPPHFLKKLSKAERQVRTKAMMRQAFLGKKAQ